jgi:DNA-binding transcriptional LysR family regulator
MDLSALADFNLVVTHGGFGKASRASGRPKATLSRRVMELEESLGVRLLDRGYRVLRLTDEGRALHARTEELLNEIVQAGAAIGERSAQPRGRLRVSAPSALAHHMLGRLAADFTGLYPEVRLEVTADDRFVDLIEEGYDLVIRANPRPDETLVGRCIRRDQFVVVAPPSLAFPSSSGNETSVSVPAILLAASADTDPWRVVREGQTFDLLPDARLRLSSILMVREAVLSGVGAALLPRWLVAEDIAADRLACWGVSDRDVAVWALYASRRHVSRKITAFVELLCAAFAADAS